MKKPSKARPKRVPGTGAATARLVELMDRLRRPDGCPWDKKQTHRSLIPYLIEETYELKEALLSGQRERMREELGDVLLQVVFHAQLAAERGAFDFEDVAHGIADKLVRRHPHVFGESRAKLSPREALARWEGQKLSEGKGKRTRLLGGVPKALPALLQAYRIQEKAAGVGFDWPNVRGVEHKLREETDEFHRALRRHDLRAQTEELGDLLFTLVNLARHIGVDPETALHSANEKFSTRFGRMEKKLRAQKTPLGKASLKVMEAAWQESKRPPRRAVRRRP